MTINQNEPTKIPDLIIWGTGDLCDRFWQVFPFKSQVARFIDSNLRGEKFGKPILEPGSLNKVPCKKLYICSTWIDEIVKNCLQLGISKEVIHVVMPRSLEVIPLTQFEQISEGRYYFLPWKLQIEDIEQSLSSDIVHPDVYKDLVKSISYCFISSVQGDFAEFGTCSGYTASLIAFAIDKYTKTLAKHEAAHKISPRKLCLFDSFEGFPEASLPEDTDSPHVASGIWGAGTAKGLSANELKSLIHRYLVKERVSVYEGWFKDTLTQINSEKKFAFVHLDCDLYESTFDVLHHLFSYQHLSEGAMLLFDNWYCNKASKAYAERRAWLALCEEFDVDYTDLGMYACVGHRMIIHSYNKK